jgi:hypothetical protein
MNKALICSLISFISVLPFHSYSQVEIILRKSFVDSIKNRITIETDFNIVHAHHRPNSISDDGDMHVAGKGRHIGLPVVAELMNARNEKEAVDFIHQNEGTPHFVSITGPWRIWCEHTRKDQDRQSQGIPFKIENTNPPHIFEIHPITKVGNINTINSLKPIREDEKEFEYKDAKKAFKRYLNAKCSITDLKDKIKIKTYGLGYNYAEFWIKLTGKQKIVEDGRFIFCSVLDKNKKVICNNIRMAFPKGSDAELKVRKLKENDIMHVVGIPRIELAAITERIEKSGSSPGILELNLPFEMIIVAIYK